MKPKKSGSSSKSDTAGQSFIFSVRSYVRPSDQREHIYLMQINDLLTEDDREFLRSLHPGLRSIGPPHFYEDIAKPKEVICEPFRDALRNIIEEDLQSIKTKETQILSEEMGSKRLKSVILRRKNGEQTYVLRFDPVPVKLLPHHYDENRRPIYAFDNDGKIIYWYKDGEVLTITGVERLRKLNSYDISTLLETLPICTEHDVFVIDWGMCERLVLGNNVNSYFIEKDHNGLIIEFATRTEPINISSDDSDDIMLEWTKSGKKYHSNLGDLTNVAFPTFENDQNMIKIYKERDKNNYHEDVLEFIWCDTGFFRGFNFEIDVNNNTFYVTHKEIQGKRFGPFDLPRELGEAPNRFPLPEPRPEE